MALIGKNIKDKGNNKYVNVTQTMIFGLKKESLTSAQLLEKKVCMALVLCPRR